MFAWVLPGELLGAARGGWPSSRRGSGARGRDERSAHRGRSRHRSCAGRPIAGVQRSALGATEAPGREGQASHPVQRRALVGRRGVRPASVAAQPPTSLRLTFVPGWSFVANAAVADRRHSGLLLELQRIHTSEHDLAVLADSNLCNGCRFDIRERVTQSNAPICRTAQTSREPVTGDVSTISRILVED